MEKEVENTIFKNGDNKKRKSKISQFKKIGYSIVKFEKYPEMAAEGVGRAIGYLAFLVFLISIIMSAFFVYEFNTILNSYLTYIEEEVSVIEYQDGNLSLELVSGEDTVITDVGTVIVNTEDLTQEEIEQYEEDVKVTDLGIIWLKDHVVIEMGDDEPYYLYYSDVLSEFEIEEFDKEALVDFLDSKISSPRLYLAFFVMEVVWVFISYLIAGILNAFILSIVGILIAACANIKMKYKAIFNMSIYAITLSTILQLIYQIIYSLFDFEIKYFDLAYSLVSFICLTAAIFMIKSDVEKQKREMMRIAQEKREKIENGEIEREEEPEKEPEEKKNDKEKEETKQEKNKEKDSGLNDETESQGSNA